MTMSKAEQKLQDYYERELPDVRAKLNKAEREIVTLRQRVDDYKKDFNICQLQLERTLGWIDCKSEKHPLQDVIPF